MLICSLLSSFGSCSFLPSSAWVVVLFNLSRTSQKGRKESNIIQKREVKGSANQMERGGNSTTKKEEVKKHHHQKRTGHGSTTPEEEEGKQHHSQGKRRKKAATSPEEGTQPLSVERRVVLFPLLLLVGGGALAILPFWEVMPCPCPSFGGACASPPLPGWCCFSICLLCLLFLLHWSGAAFQPHSLEWGKRKGGGWGRRRGVRGLPALSHSGLAWPCSGSFRTSAVRGPAATYVGHCRAVLGPRPF